MKFSVTRDAILRPLQLVAGVVEKRQTLPALGNVLIVLDGTELSLTGTDLEVEIIAKIQLEKEGSSGEITVPAKKFLDIVRSLTETSVIEFAYHEQKVTVKSGRSRFILSCLPASEFPAIELGQNELSFVCEQAEIKRLIDRTSFAMAQQDVRYYLNGMLLELRNEALRAVATDGHRLAMCTRPVNLSVDAVTQAILPRKGVIELSRLLSDSDDNIELVIGNNHLRAITEKVVFTSKLVDGKFPDYERVLPRNGDKVVLGNREELRQAFARTSILSNEKYRGVRFVVTKDLVTITANNPEQEEAEEQVVVEYDSDTIEVGFNVSYLLDITNVISTDNLKITLIDSNSSALVEEPEQSDSIYVVMPMRL